MGHVSPDVATSPDPREPEVDGGDARRGGWADPGRHGASLLVVVLLCAPVVAVGAATLDRGSSGPPRLERLYEVVPGGTVRCRHGVYVPSPSGRSFACPFGGEFRCGARRCELYRGERSPEDRWILTRDAVTGEGVLGRGGARGLAGGVWYGCVPRDAPSRGGS